MSFSDYLEVAFFLFEYMVLYYIFSQVFEQRFKSNILGYGLIGIITGANFLIDQYAGMVSGPAVIVKTVVVYLTFLLIFRGKVLHIALMCIICFISIVVADIIAVFSIAAIFGFDSFDFVMEGYNRLALVITSKFIFVAMSQMVLSKFKNLNSTNPRDLYTVIMVLLINVAFIVITGDVYFQNKSIFDNDLTFIVAVLFGIVAISIMVVRMTQSIVSFAMKERDWQLQEEEYNRQIFYLNHLEDINHEMKSIRHDFNHHIGCLHGMLEQGDMENAKTYAGELVHEAEKFNVAFSSEYPGISGLLSSKYQIMRAKDIEFQWSVNLPERLGIRLIDLSVILGNALDNAIEAVESLDEMNRNIQLKIYTEMDYLVIKIINKYQAGVILDDFLTTKEDAENHGYGLGNIRFVVKKYDGIMKIDTDDEMFRLNIALPNIN